MHGNVHLYMLNNIFLWHKIFRAEQFHLNIATRVYNYEIYIFK